MMHFTTCALAAFDIPDDVRVKTRDDHSASKLQCFDVLHFYTESITAN